MFKKDNEKVLRSQIKNFLINKTFHRTLIGLITLILAFLIVENGAVPLKYNLNLGDKSLYDISAPKDVENTVKERENAENTAAYLDPSMVHVDSVPVDVVNKVNQIFKLIQKNRDEVDINLINEGVTRKNKSYENIKKNEQALISENFATVLKKDDIILSIQQIESLLRANSKDIDNFEVIVNNKISDIEKNNITVDDLRDKVDAVQTQIQNEKLSVDFIEIGKVFAKAIIKVNYVMDTNLTNTKREKAYQTALDTNKIIIKKGDRIINKDDIVTNETLGMLRNLKLIDKSGFDLEFSLGIFGILFLLGAILVIYMNHFTREILYSRGDLILLGFIIILTILLSRFIYLLSPIAIPIFLATMLISILLDMKLAIVVNFLLVIAISFITKGDMSFIYMSIISGTLSSFIVSKANQRNKLFMSGAIIGAINIIVILSLAGIHKSRIDAIDILIAFLNGIGSIIITIGILPFLESAFNIITPMKLLELANPNQPLIKRLLMEAPGTYHHSLMVGNLAEVATEAIGGNALLSRVGAYFHDVGKLKRPNFFKENQISDNPHDRMTANLSTLVITSHTNDGLELAEKHKIPLAIRDIIKQHHGTTLVAYFYHKAKTGEKGESVISDNFRYEGPKPSSKEAAVVMLADSVEAAVRSMVDKTEGKIEGLVRKLIKDKLDDGQLDLCDLTLKDLDNIAKGFLKVLSGIFHEREEYPEIKEKVKDLEGIKDVNNIVEKEDKQQNIDEGSQNSADTY